MSSSNLAYVIDQVGAQIKILKDNIQAIQHSPHDIQSKICDKNAQQISITKSAEDKINEQFIEMIEQVKKDPNNKITVEEWVGNLMRMSVQQAHKQHFIKDDQNSMRLRFATLILEQYSKFIIQAGKIQESVKAESKIQMFSSIKLLSSFENIFKMASANAIEYLQYKYETKKNKVSDKKLTQQIKQTQKLIDPKFDLLFRSNTTLPIHSPSQLRKDIKQFLNKAINQCHEKWPMFKKDMIDIFNPTGNTDLHYQIGAKIRVSTEPYTQQQLNRPGFFIKGNEMMRVMMKWIEELLDFFQNQNRFKNNKGGFRFYGQKQMKKLITQHRKQMWDRFSNENKIVKIKLQDLKNQINSTISSIILTSDNHIKNIQSLDKSIIGLLIVSENIWKALQNYMMDTLIILLTSFYNIRIQYERQMKIQTDLQVFTFMLGDLFRCKCSGTRSDILAVWRNLKQKENNNEIRILRVKNRLNQSTNDFLINFAYEDASKCFLICQMQIALAQKTNNDDRAYHFKHFLYEMARSPHGVGVQLAIMLYYLDNRKKYLKNIDQLLKLL